MSKSTKAPLLPKGNKPVHTLRHRHIKMPIWKNQTAKGVMYTVTVSRSYMEDEMWRDSQSFGYDDLMIVAKLFSDAHSYISALREQDRVTSAASKSASTSSRK